VYDNITLGYNFGQVFKGKLIQSARAYLSLENFFGYDKYKGGFNPEATNTDVSGSSAFLKPLTMVDCPFQSLSSLV